MYPINIKKPNYNVINFEIVMEGFKFIVSWLKSFKNPREMIMFYVKSFYI